MSLRRVACFIILGLFIPTAARAADPVDFNRDIRPILSKNCFPCHGADAGTRAGKMRLDQRDSATKVNKKGRAAIVPGAPDKSELVRRITTTDASDHMPPPEAKNTPTPEQIALLTRWVREGGAYADHWAFVKPQQPPLPAVKDRAWPRNGIDHFVLARLERMGLKPTPEADRYVLLRRVSLDLRGLPPTPQEIAEFEKDTSPNAYEKAVDRLLNDERFGERWARPWLDLARYADSAGYGSADPLRTIWRYRDWVIDAFNRNLPYDQFTIEQLAGDLLPNATLDQKIATAFHRNTMTNTEGGTDREEFRVAAVKDRVSTTMQVWMGLTMGCAQCHSHKYDPITQKEYYRFVAVFNQTADNDQPDERPTIPAPTTTQLETNRKIDVRIADLKKDVVGKSIFSVETWPTRAVIEKLVRSRSQVANLPIMVELPANARRKTFVMVKGNFLNKGEEVQPGVPESFPALKETTPDRLAIAKWLVAPENPLTARVAVNRYWAQLWGTGIVATEEDFGTQGELPTHPELLDWLALEYQRRNWDTKAMLKLMVTSSAYRQSSKVSPEALVADPKNRLFTRGPRFRLEAEMVRDQALALSGLLSGKIGGPSVYPPQPSGLWQAAFNGQRTYPTSTGEDRYRRGMYTFWRRTIPYPSMTTFDAPSRETCTVRRIRTNTPLQAFVTLNDPVYVEAAQALARRILKEGGATTEERAKYALRLVLARPPVAEQVKQVAELFESERANYVKDTKGALSLATDPLGPLPMGMDATDAAAWTVVANVLLNLDGVLTKG
jgi:hypothetical protein